MDAKKLALIVMLVFGIALTLFVAYLIMQRVEKWYVMQAKKEAVGKAVEGVTDMIPSSFPFPFDKSN